MAAPPRKRGPLLSFHKVQYEVPRRFNRGSAPKKVLKEISGCCRPGEVTAIMGSSGSGKSSLIEALADRKDRHRLSGSILVDGQPRDESFLLTTGYCEQDDQLSGMLTVRENLLFSAELRLPAHMSLSAKKERVEEVIEELQLTKCADTLIGSAIIRGVSGGERKRVSLGREIVNDPRLIFLDEPTTGLDAKMASVVVDILARWADQGKTVVLSIHQPKYSIFARFHHLLLLADGEVVYNGRASGVVPYFEGLGFRAEAFNNPADWMLDILAEDGSGTTDSVASLTDRSDDDDEEDDNEEEEGIDHRGDRCEEEEWRCEEVAVKEVGRDKHQAAEVVVVVQANNNRIFAELYRESQQCGEMEEALRKIEEAAGTRRGEGEGEGGMQRMRVLTMTPSQRYQSSLWHQIGVVSKRCLLTSLRNPTQLFLQFAAMIFFALLVGGLYHGLDLGPSGIQNRIGAFFLLVMIFMFSNISALELFIEERALYLNEKTGGFYRPLAYFIARTSCDIIPLRAIPGVLFCVLTYYMVGLRSGLQALLAYTATLIMTSLSAASLCLLLSSLVPVFAVANLGVALCYILMMMSSGLLVNLQQMPAWLAPLRYVSIFRYALEALAVNEFLPLTFQCAATTATTPCTIKGSFFLATQHYGSHPSVVWVNVAILTAMFLAYMTLTFLVLRRLRKDG